MEGGASCCRNAEETLWGDTCSCFGSLARKTVFTPWSDIDLAVWGIAPEKYYQAAGAAMDIGLEEGVRVDVVDPQDCDRQFLEAVEQEGMEL